MADKITEEIKNDFISNEKKSFKVRLGRALASSLSGFLAGLIVASIIFVTLFDLAWR
jgi:acid phosphatase family membrane protein YuiD